jgi:monoamine oxidase
VVIVGAGVAGLAAAAHLDECGIPFLVLEARDRIGGRVWTTRPPSLPVPVELGAEFIHGEAPELEEMAATHGLPTVDITGRRYRSQNGALRPADDFWERIDHVMRRLDEDREPDRTFADALARNHSLDPEDRALAMQYVTGFHAANPGIISERALAEGGSPRDDVRERRIGRVLGGYGSIVDVLAERIWGRIRRGVVVSRIRWTSGHVTVSAGRSRLSGRAAIITVPIGVLAADPDERGAIEFQPALPSKESAISSLTMGGVVRIGLQFDAPFWTGKRFAAHAGDERLDTLSFLHGTGDVDFPVWWTSYPVRSPLLIGWCGGPQSLPLAALGKREIEARALKSLAELLSVKARTLETHLVASYTHDWIGDAFSRGAYSYARVGVDDASKRLARPVEGTLFFAGEAADTEGRTGTVHGAIGSGRRAAREVVRALGR